MKIKLYLENGTNAILELETISSGEQLYYCNAHNRHLRVADIKVGLPFALLSPPDKAPIISRIVKLFDPTKRFYFTFGSKYEFEAHPLNAHPQGYILIIADHEGLARMKMHKLCGDKWAFCYRHHQFKPQRGYYPLGELGRYTA